VTTYDAAWYDVAMTEADAPSMIPLEDSPWFTTYLEVAQMIDPHEEVVDLGCGTGRFLELLYRRNHYGRVTGIDWSQMALLESASYVKPRHADAPPPEWLLCDLMDWRPDPLRSGNAVYVCTEVLEHIEEDRELVRRIPPGHRFIFSVPNFDSESHVRVFRSVSEIWKRYDRLLHFRRWVMVGTERQGIHICETRRRGDSW